MVLPETKGSALAETGNDSIIYEKERAALACAIHDTPSSFCQMPSLQLKLGAESTL